MVVTLPDTPEDALTVGEFVRMVVCVAFENMVELIDEETVVVIFELRTDVEFDREAWVSIASVEEIVVVKFLVTIGEEPLYDELLKVLVTVPSKNSVEVALVGDGAVVFVLMMPGKDGFADNELFRAAATVLFSKTVNGATVVATVMLPPGTILLDVDACVVFVELIDDGTLVVIFWVIIKDEFVESESLKTLACVV